MTSNSDKHRTQNGNGKQKDLWVNQQVSFIFLHTKKNISDEEKETTQLSTTNEQLNEQTSETNELESICLRMC